MIRSKKDYKEYLSRDAENGTFSTTLFSFFFNDIWSFLRLLRLLEYLTNTKTGLFWGIVRIFVLLRFKIKSKKLGFSIPPNVFGPGLMLPHFGTIVVNRKVRVGANCKLHVGTNIGASYSDENAVPIIGDDCYIAPGAKIFGKIIIASNVKIGANAVVNKSCDLEHSSLLGIPAKIYQNKKT